MINTKKIVKRILPTKDIYSKNATSSSGTKRSIGGGISTTSSTARYTGGVGKSSVTFTKAGSSSGGGGGGASSTPTADKGPLANKVVLITPKDGAQAGITTAYVGGQKIGSGTYKDTRYVPGTNIQNMVDGKVVFTPTPGTEVKLESVKVETPVMQQAPVTTPSGKIIIDSKAGTSLDLRGQSYLQYAGKKAEEKGYQTPTGYVSQKTVTKTVQTPVLQQPSNVIMNLEPNRQIQPQSAIMGGDVSPILKDAFKWQGFQPITLQSGAPVSQGYSQPVQSTLSLKAAEITAKTGLSGAGETFQSFITMPTALRLGLIQPTSKEDLKLDVSKSPFIIPGPVADKTLKQIEYPETVRQFLGIPEPKPIQTITTVYEKPSSKQVFTEALGRFYYDPLSRKDELNQILDWGKTRVQELEKVRSDTYLKQNELAQKSQDLQKNILTETASLSLNQINLDKKRADIEVKKLAGTATKEEIEAYNLEKKDYDTRKETLNKNIETYYKDLSNLEKEYKQAETDRLEATKGLTSITKYVTDEVEKIKRKDIIYEKEKKYEDILKQGVESFKYSLGKGDVGGAAGSFAAGAGAFSGIAFGKVLEGSRAISEFLVGSPVRKYQDLYSEIKSDKDITISDIGKYLIRANPTQILARGVYDWEKAQGAKFSEMGAEGAIGTILMGPKFIKGLTKMAGPGQMLPKLPTAGLDVTKSVAPTLAQQLIKPAIGLTVLGSLTYGPTVYTNYQINKEIGKIDTALENLESQKYNLPKKEYENLKDYYETQKTIIEGQKQSYLTTTAKGLGSFAFYAGGMKAAEGIGARLAPRATSPITIETVSKTPTVTRMGGEVSSPVFEPSKKTGFVEKTVSLKNAKVESVKYPNAQDIINMRQGNIEFSPYTKDVLRSKYNILGQKLSYGDEKISTT